MGFAAVLQHGCHENASMAQEGAASALTLPLTAVPLREDAAITPGPYLLPAFEGTLPALRTTLSTGNAWSPERRASLGLQKLSE